MLAVAARRDAEVGVADLLARLELRQRGADEADRDGEADARVLLRATRRDLVGDADHLAGGVEQRPAGVAGFSAASVWMAWATVKPLGALIVRSTPVAEGGAEQRGGAGPSVREGDRDRRGAVDDVRRRDDVAGGGFFLVGAVRVPRSSATDLAVA